MLILWIPKSEKYYKHQPEKFLFSGTLPSKLTEK